MNYEVVDKYHQDDIQEILKKHKGRMRKLISGEFTPSSDNERRFLTYANDKNAFPTNIYEKAWEQYTLEQDRNLEPSTLNNLVASAA